MGLKTMEDIYGLSCFDRGEFLKNEEYFSLTQLKQEAVKHIINLLDNADISVDMFLHDNNDYPIQGPRDVDRVSYIAMAVAFQSFFNITDEELNDVISEQGDGDSK